MLVTFTAPARQQAGSLATVTVTTDNSGVATAPGFAANSIAGSYVVTASAGALTAQFNLTNDPGAASKLVITQQPATATAGIAFTTQPVVKLEDALGNVITGDSTDTVIAARGDTGMASLQGGPLTVMFVNGVATFSGLSYNVAETMNILFTTSAGAFLATSTIVVSAGAAASIAVVSGDGQSHGQHTLRRSARDRGRDEFGNLVPNASVTFTAPGASASGTFSNGMATITGMTDANGQVSEPFTANTRSGSYTVSASATGVGTPASFSLTNAPGSISAAKSVVSVASGNLASGTGETVTLTAKDAFGNLLTTGGSTVVFSASGGTSTGAFGTVADNGNGTYTVTFTGNVAGTATTIGATIDGNAVTSTLPTITVTHGAFDGLHSTLSVASGTLASHSQT